MTDSLQLIVNYFIINSNLFIYVIYIIISIIIIILIISLTN